ncbi:GNAT family N-acetyltransferase [Saccharibacillus sp. JS10]|uniref:GNAT family N-acetyltransferase n=1 Tax=Saccharibacillus sp. JS10 TaxID=2950552 RepID=UPI00210C2137|nr:GNAT family N-acetyltransferase [Saccharibacillus sp. JS10]MCQ4087664.1 GNAT family N-acetyltransferase [Saccharibacillus sp. JS10]
MNKQISEERQNSAVTVRLIDYGSDEHRQSLNLRDEVLRRPLGHSLFDDDLSGDVSAIHIAAFAQDRLVGILLLCSKGEHVLQMRQVAVDETLRGMQIGRKMVEYAEEVAIQQQTQELMLHAREVAVLFYEKLGYAREGERFEEVGIPHYRMRKKLTS